MRTRIIALAALTAISTMTLAGCGSPSKTEAWSKVSEDANGFYAKAAKTDLSGLDDNKTSEVVKAVGYKFNDGVKIAKTTDDGVCLTGPDDTYMTITVGDSLKRTLGTGPCDFADGDIVIESDLDASEAKGKIVEKVTKGADLAKKVDGLTAFPHVLETVVRSALDDAINKTADCIDTPDAC